MPIISTTDDWKVPVEFIPMKQAFPEMGTLEEFREKTVVLTEDHTRLFSVVSAKTPMFTHEEVADTFSAALDSIYKKEMNIDLLSLKRGAQIQLRVDLPDNVIEIGPNDTAHLRLYLTNSYDKALPFVLKAGAFRHECENSCVIGTQIGKITSRDMADSWSPESLAVKIERLVEKVMRIGSMWKVWAVKEIHYPTALEALSNKMPEKMLAKFVNDETIYPMTVWEFYNMITQELTHGDYSDRARLQYDGVVASIFYSPKNPIRKLCQTEEAALEEAEHPEE